MSDFFPVLKEGVVIFFPSIGPATPFEMRQEKTWLQLQISGMMIKEKQQEFAAKNEKGAAAKSYFPYSVW